MNPIIKIYYRRNLNMSGSKLAAVCTHIGKELALQNPMYFEGNDFMKDKVIVLEASDKKFNEYVNDFLAYDIPHHIHVDSGLKEVEKGTACAVGFVYYDE